MISGSGTTPTSLARAATAQRVGATVVAVTRDDDSELAGLAGACLRVPTVDGGRSLLAREPSPPEQRRGNDG